MAPARRTLFALAAAAACAALAFPASTSLSECAYVAVPAFALAFYLGGAADMRRALTERMRPVAVIGIGILILAMCLVQALMGPAALTTWHVWSEVGTSLYFATAVLLVVIAIRVFLRGAAQAAGTRWRLPASLRFIACDIVPVGLFFLLALPYALAFAQVHRFKLPNLSDPLAAQGRHYEAITLASADGTTLRGWWIPARTSTTSGPDAVCPRTLIICHGIAGNRSITLPFVEVGDWLEANVLMFDLRGHGDSDGRTVTFGYREKEDVVAAIAYVRRERPACAEEVIGMGMSLGAACMAQAAALVEPPLDGVILDSPFASTEEMTGRVLRALPRFTLPWLTGLGMPIADWHAGCPIMSVRPEELIDRLRSPVVFLHSRGDPLIPSEHSVRMHDRACAPKRLCVFEITGHCNAFFADRERYRSEVLAGMAPLRRKNLEGE